MQSSWNEMLYNTIVCLYSSENTCA